MAETAGSSMGRSIQLKEREFLTSRQAAELLGVALSTVQLWTENGVLRAWKTSGGHRRITRQSVGEVLRQQRAAAEAGHAGDKATAVVVEDHPEMRRLYERQFAARRLPVRLVMASNGFEGLVQIGHCLPDIIITDLLMPGMDGFEMIRALRGMSQLKDTMTIVVSGLGREDTDKQGGLPPDLGFFQKPVNFDMLEKAIRDRLARQVRA